ncbi:MAG: metallophosphoesterase [Pseudomonadales bacterium]
MTFNIAIIGDLHSHWDDIDVVQFNRSAYDLLLFTGDLGGGTRESSLRMAKSLAQLSKDTLVMPGNHDTVSIAELAAELSHRSGSNALAAVRSGSAATPAAIRLCGFSSHRIVRDAIDVTLITGRPHSLGGPELAYPEHMAREYRIDSLEASQRRLAALVDRAESDRLLFFSHNGPVGLGDAPDAMWGCDFRPGGGDWGDPDLRGAIDYALAQGREVLAVIGGHMHLRTRCNRERPWLQHHQGVSYVNAARVPRIAVGEVDTHRHHLAATLTSQGIEVREVFVPQTCA